MRTATDRAGMGQKTSFTFEEITADGRCDPFGASLTPVEVVGVVGTVVSVVVRVGVRKDVLWFRNSIGDGEKSQQGKQDQDLDHGGWIADAAGPASPV